MMKRAVFRQVRFCLSSSSLSGSQLAIRPTIQTWKSNSVLASHASALRRPSRWYSAVAAEQVSDDPTPTPAGPITKFSDLPSLGVHKNLVDAVQLGMGYDTMTDVQSMTINPALAGKDVVAQAKTGTGKTLAFLIPIVQRIIAGDPSLAHQSRSRARIGADNIRAIVMSPTRELAEQIGAEARALCRRTNIKVQTAVGGTQKRAMLSRARMEGCHLLVATPGRLNDLLQDEYSGIDAPNLSMLVLDEADRMLDVGFERELQDILRNLPDRSHVPRQTLLFSATLPKNVVGLARTYVDKNNFEFVQTVKADEEPTHEKVPQYIVPTKGLVNQLPAAFELMERHALASKTDEETPPLKAMIFLQTTATVQLVYAVMEKLQRKNKWMPQVYLIHSKLSQGQRTYAADSFRRARSAILISSDVTARGMDFPNVSHVIQMGIPSSRDQYIHRIGRTGRAGKGGQAWLFVADNEIDYARRVLPDLPIKRASNLESAAYNHTSASPSRPSAVTQVSEAYQGIPSDILSSSYKSHLAGGASVVPMDLVIENMNEWTKHGWGWDLPPAVSRIMAAKSGLTRVRGLRIDDRDDDRGSYRRDRGRGPARRSGGDSFDNVFRSAEESGGRGYRSRRPSF